MSGRRERRVVGVGAPGKVTFARGQRQQPTRAEALLWRALRREQLGVKFRRQHAVGEFVRCDLEGALQVIREALEY